MQLMPTERTKSSPKKMRPTQEETRCGQKKTDHIEEPVELAAGFEAVMTRADHASHVACQPRSGS